MSKSIYLVNFKAVDHDSMEKFSSMVEKKIKEADANAVVIIYCGLDVEITKIN